MPRDCGVSLTSTVWPMRRSPSERSVSSCGFVEPLPDLTCVTLSGRSSSRSRGDLLGGRLLAARGGGLVAGRLVGAVGRDVLAAAGVLRETEHLVDRQAAQLGDLTRGAQALEARRPSP